MKRFFVLILLPSLLSILSSCQRESREPGSGKIYIMEKNGKSIAMIENREIIKILDLPKTRQGLNWTCGANAVQKICAYYGEDFREMDLIRELKSTPEDGTFLQPIIDFFLKHKFRVDVKEHMTIGEVKDYIDRDIPVIMMIQAWGKNTSEYKGWENGHYSVCIGYTRDELLFADPSLYDIGYIPNNEIYGRWHDYDAGGRKYFRLGIAVYGKRPNFDLEKIEEIK